MTCRRPVVWLFGSNLPLWSRLTLNFSVLCIVFVSKVRLYLVRSASEIGIACQLVSQTFHASMIRYNTYIFPICRVFNEIDVGIYKIYCATKDAVSIARWSRISVVYCHKLRQLWIPWFSKSNQLKHHKSLSLGFLVSPMRLGYCMSAQHT